MAKEIDGIRRYIRALCYVYKKRKITMKVSEKTVDYIKKKEGFEPVPKKCPAGIMTIGYGHAVKHGEKFPREIDESTALKILRKDIAEVEVFVNSLGYEWLSQEQFEALVSLVFNCGQGKFLSFKHLPKALSEQNFESIKKNWLDIVHAGGKKLPGLVKRRIEEYDHGFNGIEWNSK